MGTVLEFGKRRGVTMIVYDGNDTTEGPPIDLISFYAWISEMIGRVPTDCLDTAQFMIETLETSDDVFANVRITYERPETDDELQERAIRERHCRYLIEERERKLLRELRAKYPD